MKPLPLPLTALALLLQFGCEGASKAGSKPSPDSPGKESPMTQKPVKTIPPEILALFCGQPSGPAPTVVKVHKDSAGNIGGYSHKLLIMDSPIFYLDSAGNPLATFHIFGSDAEKKKNQPHIDALLKAFPVEEELSAGHPDCQTLTP
jgi:hypothetical protein